VLAFEQVWFALRTRSVLTQALGLFFLFFFYLRSRNVFTQAVLFQFEVERGA